MTENEFINRMIGTPWVLHSSQFDGADCWGVVVLYYRHVHGIELADTHKMDMQSGMIAQLATGKWSETVVPYNGITFMAYRHGVPAHCGVVADGGVLHSGGGPTRDGSCRFDRISVMQRLYPDMRYFRHVEVNQ